MQIKSSNMKANGSWHLHEEFPWTCLLSFQCICNFSYHHILSYFACLLVFARATITQYHTLSGLNRNSFSHSSKARLLRLRCLQFWFILRSLSLVYRWPPSCCLFTCWSSVHTLLCCLLVCLKFLFLHEHQSHWIRAHAYPFISPYLPLEALSPNSHNHRSYIRLRLQHMNFTRRQFTHISMFS